MKACIAKAFEKDLHGLTGVFLEAPFNMMLAQKGLSIRGSNALRRCFSDSEKQTRRGGSWLWVPAYADQAGVDHSHVHVGVPQQAIQSPVFCFHIAHVSIDVHQLDDYQVIVGDRRTAAAMRRRYPATSLPAYYSARGQPFRGHVRLLNKHPWPKQIAPMRL